MQQVAHWHDAGTDTRLGTVRYSTVPGSPVLSAYLPDARWAGDQEAAAAIRAALRADGIDVQSVRMIGTTGQRCAIVTTY